VMKLFEEAELRQQIDLHGYSVRLSLTHVFSKYLIAGWHVTWQA